MTDFSQQIATFVNYGTYDYRLDEVGNVILNPSSSTFQNHYIPFDLRDLVYNQSKLSSFYDFNFTEFIPIPITTASASDISSSLALTAAEVENAQLSAQLDQLISQNEQLSTTSDEQVVKDIIIDLRIQLGEGTSEADFQEEFPYMPVVLSTRELPPTQ